MKIRVSPSELASTLDSTARTFNLPPNRLTTDRRDAGLALVDTQTGRELTSYCLTAREMDAALTIAAALADISPAIVQPIATSFALQEDATFLSAAQMARYRRAVMPCANCGAEAHPEAMHYDPEEEIAYCSFCANRTDATLQPPINPAA